MSAGAALPYFSRFCGISHFIFSSLFRRNHAGIRDCFDARQRRQGQLPGFGGQAELGQETKGSGPRVSEYEAGPCLAVISDVGEAKEASWVQARVSGLRGSNEGRVPGS